MSRYLIGMDIGGTSVKTSIIDIDNPTSKVCEECFNSFGINSSSESYEEVITSFVSVFNDTYKTAKAYKYPIYGIGIATPGPFDHKKGVSYMRHKYKALYGINLKDIFWNFLGKPAKCLIFFEDDCRAFLLGETLYGAAKEFTRCIGITIGTGLGAGFIDNKKFMLEGKGVPYRGQIWSLPYKNGVVDDIVSKKGIISLYKKYSRTETVEVEVEDIAQRAFVGDKSAIKAFAKVGKILGEILKPIAEEFEAECLVFGGNISRSYSLFAKSLNDELKTLSHLKKIAQAEAIDFSVFYGLAHQYKVYSCASQNELQ